MFEFLTKLFRRGKRTEENATAKAAGQPVYVNATAGPERRHQRDLNRMNQAARKMRDMEAKGVGPEDPTYQAWSIEHAKRSTSVREYNLKRRTK